MVLLGIDVGTTGCKVAAFSRDGVLRELAYTEYDIQRPDPHKAELNAEAIWPAIQETIARTVTSSRKYGDVGGVSVTSMGENLVPIDRNRKILGPSILNIDRRGEEYLPRLREAMSDHELYRVNGNVWGNQFSLPKLMWIRDHQPRLYEQTYKFLHWGPFVLFMLGGEPVIDYSLANRSLLFDINTCDWSDQLLSIGGIDRNKLPVTAEAGTQSGEVSRAIAENTGLPLGTPLFVGAHDQCANALGCGVVNEGTAMYGMGTFPTIAPVYSGGVNPEVMVANSLNTEHHAVPGKFVSFLFHMGGATLKWYRNEFAPDKSYQELFEEMPHDPAPLLILPRFTPMGPPDYEADACAVIEGMTSQTTRGELLKGIVEANTFALKFLVAKLPSAGIEIDSYVAVGGGSRSDRSLQIAADILGKPIVRSTVREAGALGAALLAGIGTGTYTGFQDAANASGSTEREFEPDARRVEVYGQVFELYKELRTTMTPLIERWVELRGGITDSLTP